MDKTYSIFKNEAGRRTFLDAYDRVMNLWQAREIAAFLHEA